MVDLDAFLQLADEVDRGAVDELLSSLAVERCRSSWNQRLRDADPDATALVERALQVEGAIRALAHEMLVPPDA
jgi:hypothetical protein